MSWNSIEINTLRLVCILTEAVMCLVPIEIVTFMYVVCELVRFYHLQLEGIYHTDAEAV